MEELRREMAAAHQPVELAVARANHAKTMCLLRALTSGSIRIEQVVIDGENWQVLDPTQVTVLAPQTPEPREAPEG